MKALYWIIPCFLLVIFSLRGAGLEEIVITSQANEYAVSGNPIVCSIIVTHEKDQKVDEKSFKLGEDPVVVEFIKDVQMSPDSNLIVSIYKFTLGPKLPGTYTLPPVTVVVGGNSYSSLESTYDVQGKVIQ